MMLALTIIHLVISLALIIVVLMQHGKQQGLSGSIAGGAETFFGKNKGRTIDAMLKKFTAVVAILFVISSVVFTAVAVSNYNKANEAPAVEAGQTEAMTEGEVPEGAVTGSLDENGNLVDAEGNILMSAEDLAAAQEQAAQEQAAETATEGEAETAETPAE